MILWNTITSGLLETWTNRFRSALTMLGIILGVSSLVAMSAMVKGMENGLKQALFEMGGLEKLEIQAEDDLPIYQRHLEDQIPGLRLSDVHALKANATLLSDIAPSIEKHYRSRNRIYTSRNGKYSRPWKSAGAWNEVLDSEKHVVEYGRRFHSIDEEEARSVAIIGTTIRDELFGRAEEGQEPINPVGEIIQINRQPFVIIGLFEHYESESAKKEREQRLKQKKNQADSGVRKSGRPSWSGDSDDWIYRLKNDSLYIPLNTMLKKFQSGSSDDGSADPKLTHITAQFSDLDRIEEAIQQARNIIHLTHNGIEDFRFRTEEDKAEDVALSITNYRSSGNLIAAICLVVGGIGIMNIMLASISQRIREIGVRKSVGATTGAIFLQILVESILIAIIGGVIGVIVSLGLVKVIDLVTPAANDPQITARAMITAFSFSGLVGALAGLIPAIKAARLEPIQALKYD